MVTMKITYPSASLKRNYTITVLLPVEQDMASKKILVSSDTRYRALYLFHGFGGDCNDWILNTRIYQYAEKHKIAVIMPSGENSFFLDNPNSEEAYSNLVVNELLDMTRALFPLSDKREDTMIGGLSMGGFGAICNGLRFPEKFGAIIAMSSALITENVAKMTPDHQDYLAGYSYYKYIFGEPKDVLNGNGNPKYLAEKLKQSGESVPEIFLACGTEDFVIEENRSLDRYLTEIQIPHTYIEDKGNHDWDFWDKYIQVALEWIDKKQDKDGTQYDSTGNNK